MHDVEFGLEHRGLVDGPTQCPSGGTGVVDADDDAAGRHGFMVSCRRQSTQGRRSPLTVDSGPARGLVPL